MSKVTDIIADVARIDSVESTANASAPQATTYTKVESDAITDLLAPQATTYTKLESDAITDLLAPQATTYTKNEIDTLASNYSLKANPTFTGMITEEVSVSTLTLGATSSVQTYTATADFTIVDDLVSGESVTLVLTNGGFTPTYPTITWWDNADGTTEPTLQTTDKIKFEKVGATLYGSHIGSIL